jgi:hypothetical protein
MTSSKPPPLMSKWGLKLVSTAVLALIVGTWKIPVGLAPLRSTLPTRPRIRQDTVLRAGRSAVGRAFVPVTRSVSMMFVHARSRHSSTTAPSTPGGSAQRRVGRRCVTSPSDTGASGLGASSATQTVAVARLRTVTQSWHRAYHDADRVSSVGIGFRTPDRMRNPMTTRRRIVVGSLAGAAAIHLAMLACSGTDTSALAGRDGGGADGAADVATVDVGRGDDAPTVTDAGGLLDAFLDAVRDAIGDVADAEVRDAHAGGDGGVTDAGTPACACPPPPVPAAYTFSGRANGLAFFGPSSAARLEVRALPPGYAPFGTVEPAVRIAVGFSAWVSSSRTPSAPNTYVNVDCTGLIVDGAGRVVGTGGVSCRVHNVDSGSDSSDNSVTANATVTTFSATQVEVRIASLSFPNSLGRFVGPAFTDLVFRATDPNGHYATPSGAYVP